MKDYYAVIMAGGGGTRLWPLSRKKQPKQMLKIFGEQTLFQIAVNRLHGLFQDQNICVVTTQDQFDKLSPTAPQLKKDQYLLEPEPKGTAAVIGLAAIRLFRQNPEAVMAVLTADHIIQNIKLFHAALSQAYQLAQEGFLVTLGMVPNQPSTGYGYIQKGEVVPSAQDLVANRVIRFVEKPDYDTAVQYLKSGEYLWNGGMFFWRVDKILDEFQKQMPELFDFLQKINHRWDESGDDAPFDEIWKDIKPQTVDYGIMEHAENVTVIPLKDLGWNDVGSWDSLSEVINTDEYGNIMLANTNSTLDTQGCIVYEDDPKKLISVLGVKDLVVIDTPDALLICPRSEAQRIREVVADVKLKHQERYL